MSYLYFWIIYLIVIAAIIGCVALGMFMRKLYYEAKDARRALKALYKELGYKFDTYYDGSFAGLSRGWISEEQLAQPVPRSEFNERADNLNRYLRTLENHLGITFKEKNVPGTSARLETSFEKVAKK